MVFTTDNGWGSALQPKTGIAGRTATAFGTSGVGSGEVSLSG